MGRISRGFELFYLLTPYPEFLPDPPDPTDAHFHAMGGKILPKSFWPRRSGVSFCELPLSLFQAVLHPGHVLRGYAKATRSIRFVIPLIPEIPDKAEAENI